MVADIVSYYHPWQLYLLAVFAVGWLLGGGWLFFRGLRKHSDIPVRRLKYHRGLLASLTSGAAGIFVGLLLAAVFYRLSKRLEADWLIILGASAGVVIGLLAAYVIAYVVMGLSAKATLKVAGPPILGTLALAGILVVAFAPLTVSQTAANLAKEDCRENMRQVMECFKWCDANGLPLKDLQALVKEGALSQKYLKCSGNKGRAVGYFSLARNIKIKKIKNPEQTLVACDFAGNHPGGRNVIFADWHVDWCSDSDFADLLNLPANEAFAKALRAAEAK